MEANRMDLNPFRRLWPHRVVFALAMLCALSTVGCSGNRSAPGNILGYNHTDRHIARYSVNGYGASSIAPHEGGGKFTCCIGVPPKWQPDMSVTVAWRWHESDEVHTAEIPVPAYDRAGDVAVHFLRSGQVKVFVTSYSLWHPDYPLRGEEATMKPGDPL